jgi:DNA repair protein SbcC/Rad50
MRLLQLSLRNYRVFEQVDLDLPARVIGIFGPNGSGKCLPGWTRIFDADSGELLPVEQFVREHRKRTLGLRDGRIQTVGVTNWHELEPRPIVRLRLSNGARFDLADTHPVLTDRGCVPANQLSPGDWVAEARSLPARGLPSITVDEAYLIGLLLGDGTLNKGVSLSATDPSVIELFRTLVERVFPGCTIGCSSRGSRSRTWIVKSALSAEGRRHRTRQLARRLTMAGVPLHHYLGSNLGRFMRGAAALSFGLLKEIEEQYGLDLYEDRCALHGGRMLVEWARELGLLGTVAATKHVPRNLLLLPDEQARALVAGLWVTDGWVVPERPDIALGSDSEQLVRDIRIVLLRLGIGSSLTVQHRRGEPAHYRVNISGSGARNFGQIPLVGRKAKRLEEALGVLKKRRSWPNSDLLPPSYNAGLPTRSFSGSYRSRKQLERHAMSRETFLTFGGDLGIARAETMWSRVVSVDPLGERHPCFDITVESDESLYLAETLLVHNSSLIESVGYALYGRARTDKKLIRTHGVLTDCQVRLAFEHGGQQYEVRRTIRGKNHQTDAELFVGNAQLAAGVTDVDAEIRRLLKMEHRVFRASVFADQKQLDAFSDVRPGDRKEMALRLLGITPVEKARAAARKEARDRKKSVEQLAGALPDLGALEQEATRAREAASEAAKRTEAARDALRDCEARAGDAEEAFEASDRVRERVELIAVERDGLEGRAGDADERRKALVEQIDRLETELAGLPDARKEHAALAGVAERLAAGRKALGVAEDVRALEVELEGLPDSDPGTAKEELKGAEAAFRKADRAATKAESAHDQAREALAAAEAVLADADTLDPSAPCPTCGQELGAGFGSYVRHCRDEVSRLKREVTATAKASRDAAAAVKEADRRLSVATSEERAARDTAGARDSLKGRLEKARSRLAETTAPWDGAIPDLEELTAEAEREAELGRRVAALEAEAKHLGRAREDLERATEEIRSCRKRIAALDREAARLAFDPEDHARLAKERDESRRLLEGARTAERDAAAVLAEARREADRLDGAIEQARETAANVADLREEARYTDRVSVLLDGFRDHLVARIGPELSREAEALFRDLTNHEYEDLKIDEDTLTIHIADGADYFAVERFSGSESDLANLALRVAISTHLSRMSGADVGMMVLDEVLGALDAERKDLFVQTMGRLSGRFHQLFVITHAEQVKDQFPASIEVRKVGRRRSQAVLI